MVVSKKVDDLLGMLGAIVFFLVIVILVMAPFIMIPALFALVFQECYLDSPWTWETVVLGGLVLFALGMGVSPAHGGVGEGRRPLDSSCGQQGL